MLHQDFKFSVQDVQNCFSQLSITKPSATIRSTRTTLKFRKPQDYRVPMASENIEEEGARHLQLCIRHSSDRDNVIRQELSNTPLFSRKVLNMARKHSVETNTADGNDETFPQYGLLGIRQATYDGTAETAEDENIENLVYANVNAPWSTFICGSQGGGKSHTLSCLLENALQPNSTTGPLPKPLSGIIFHYDRFTGTAAHQVCEAAYLCSAGIPIRVLVSPSNYEAMKNLYENLPNTKGAQPKVFPLYLSDDQLNITNIITLMSIDQDSGHVPLYLETLFRVLREMAKESKGKPGLNYVDFKYRLEAQKFSRDQSAPLQLRLQLLESFLECMNKSEGAGIEGIWNFPEGSLTIVDLSDPFVNSNDACSLFKICLSLFLERRDHGRCIVALDEAHKFLTPSGAAMEFTDALTAVITQQRHLATRVIIATQEPTLSPRLLALCNVSIVHRFLSPAWFSVIRSHLAGAGLIDGNAKELFDIIVGLRTGQALIFSPAATLDVAQGLDSPVSTMDFTQLKARYIKIRIRERVSTDGGKAILATDQPISATQQIQNTPQTQSTQGGNSRKKRSQK